MILFKLIFENDEVVCKLVFDHGPHFESLEDGGRVTDTPEEIEILMKMDV